MALNILAFLPLADQVREDYRRPLAALEPRPDLTVATTLDEAAAAMPAADVFVAFGIHVKRDIFAEAHRLKWVHALGTGLDGLVDAPSLRRDVIVSATRGIHGASMSELAFQQMLSLARDFPRAVQAQARAAWERWPMRLLSGRTVGILGTGLIAEALAPRCQAFGMRVLGFSRQPRPLPHFDEVIARDRLVEAAPDLDFLVILVPLDAETRKIVDRRVIAALKPTSFVINLARGGVLDEGALAEALEAGRLAGAALDAFEEEPLPPDSPLWRTKNMIITPHVGGFFDTYPAEAVAQFAANFASFAAGRPEAMLNRER